MRQAEQKWPNHLVIVRHGESTLNVQRHLADERGDDAYGGERRNPDVELSEVGCKQALETGKFLASRYSFDVVYASPYRRTQQTIELILRGFTDAPEVILDERIREKEFGILDGVTATGIATRFPDEAKRKNFVGKYYYRPPGGENYPDVNLRIHSFLGTLTRDWSQSSVLVVCHAVIVMAFRRLLDRLTEEEVLRIDADSSQKVRNCSTTLYEFDPHSKPGGKLVLTEFSGVHYSDAPTQAEPPRTSSTP